MVVDVIPKLGGHIIFPRHLLYLYSLTKENRRNQIQTKKQFWCLDTYDILIELKCHAS